MIQDVDETLRRLLVSELSKLPETLISEAAQVTFDTPVTVEGAAASRSRVNLYLHDVRENLQLRDESWALVRKTQDGIAGRKRPPVRLDLSYLVTAHVPDNPSQEHRLLSDVLGVLLRFPYAPVEHLADSLEGKGPEALPIKVAQPDHLPHSDPATLWQALGGALRPALGVVVTAEFDPFETKWTRVVREAVLGIGQGVPPYGPQRPLDISGVRVSAAGVVTSEDGQKPLPDVTVTVAGRDERAGTDSRGFFYLLDLPPGSRKLTFRKRGYRDQEIETVCPPPGRPDQLEPMVVSMTSMTDSERAAEETRLVEAALNAPSLVEMERVYHVSLAGRLRHSDGRPAQNVPIRVGRHHTTTDGDGMYSFYDLPPGEHKLVADLPGVGEVDVKTMDGTGLLTLPSPEKVAATGAPRRQKKED